MIGLFLNNELKGYGRMRTLPNFRSVASAVAEGTIFVPEIVMTLDLIFIHIQ
jgi:hypothetical protein